MASSHLGIPIEKESNLLRTRELSKSAQILTKSNTLPESEKAPSTPDSRGSENLTKQPWYSSMMNLMRTKSKKKLYSPTDSVNPSPNLDENVPWEKRLSGDFYASEFKQKILTPKRRRSRVIYRNLKPRDSFLHSQQRQEEFLKKQLCDIEAQMEYLSGTMKFEVVGVSGPSQYLNKDEFKVNLRQGSPVLHSLYECDGVKNALLPLHKTTFIGMNSVTTDDKWSLHGRVESGSTFMRRRKDSLQMVLGKDESYVFPKQIWNHPGYIFSPTIHGVFTLKSAIEKIKRSVKLSRYLSLFRIDEMEGGDSMLQIIVILEAVIF
ncbi:unnamed protein product [Echinostoma caproni]|uniref:Doublecortin domain-containing protein n=1 Tax=Echinostoma caproni TaxID=27848 RepID=A0A183ABU2_9TREM|nr:unnamed protein product [Echinostoma caproni]